MPLLHHRFLFSKLSIAVTLLSSPLLYSQTLNSSSSILSIPELKPSNSSVFSASFPFSKVNCSVENFGLRQFSSKMAWRCSADSNEDLVNNLKAARIIKSEKVEKAMKSVDRKHYASQDPYQDSPQRLGFGATISAPHMHAHALQNLEPFLQPGMKVLDIGCGSGYLTSCLAEMVGPEGKVIGLEHIKELTEMSRKNIQRDRPEFLESQRVTLVHGDGRKGYPEEAPYDCIHVGAAAEKTPQALIDQLKAPGRLFIPVGNYYQSIYQIDKDENGKISQKELMGVMYVPLTDADKQWGN